MKGNFLGKALGMLVVGILLSCFMGVNVQAEEPTLIYDAEGLAAINNDLAGNYKLAGDIELTEEWTPLAPGSWRTPFFTGTLDGDGFTISGLKTAPEEGASLIAKLGTDGIIKNLKIETSEGGVVGFWPVGGLVAYMDDGLIENCHVNGTVSSDDAAGLLVGQMSGGAVSKCSTEGTVSVDSQGGGLIGYMDGGSVENCYSHANVEGNSALGGLIGYIEEALVSCSYVGGGVVNEGLDTGRFIGQGEGGDIEDCYYEEMSEMDAIGDGGFNMNGSPESKTRTQLTSGSRLGDFSDEIWWFVIGEYPRFRTEDDIPSDEKLPAPKEVEAGIVGDEAQWDVKVSFLSVKGAVGYRFQLYNESGEPCGEPLYKDGPTGSGSNTKISYNVTDLVKATMRSENNTVPGKTQFTYKVGVVARTESPGILDSEPVIVSLNTTFRLLTSVELSANFICERNDDIKDDLSEKITGSVGDGAVELPLDWRKVNVSTEVDGKMTYTPEVLYPVGVINALDLPITQTVEVYGRYLPPAELKWDESIPSKALWTPTECARAISVQLLKDGVPIGEWKLIPLGEEAQEYDFTKMIAEAGPGSYTFQVKALASMDGYTKESPLVVCSTPYIYEKASSSPGDGTDAAGGNGSGTGKEDTKVVIGSKTLTGDSARIFIWLILLLMALLVLLIGIIKQRGRKKLDIE